MQKNTPSCQVHMEHSPGQTTCWVTNQTSINLRKFKSHQASFPNTMLLDQTSITRKKKTVENTSMQILNNMFLTNQQVTEEIKREIKEKFQKEMTMKARQLKTYQIRLDQISPSVYCDPHYSITASSALLVSYTIEVTNRFKGLV